MTFHSKIAMSDSQQYIWNLTLKKIVHFSKLKSVWFFLISKKCATATANLEDTFGDNPHTNNRFEFKQNHGYLIYTWSDEAFKGIVINWATPSLHWGSLKITRTVPLICTVGMWPASLSG